MIASKLHFGQRYYIQDIKYNGQVINQLGQIVLVK